MATKTFTFEKTFGPSASFTGLILIVSGIAASFHSVAALVLILPRAYLAFTNTSTTVDFKNRKVRHTTNMFGIFKSGHWINIEDDMLLGIKNDKKGFRSYSRSNRTLDIQFKIKKIYLLDQFGKIIIPINKIKSNNKLKELQELSEALHLKTFTRKVVN